MSKNSPIELVVREQWGKVLANLVAHIGDFQLAEDMLQEAVLIALEHWPTDGVPLQPAAWLLRTAKNKAIDNFRREANFRSKQTQLTLLVELQQEFAQDEMDSSMVDERLSMIFTCCHPALSPQARVALTLRTLGGITTTEIARAFLVPDITMAQRLVRAQKKIKVANIPYQVPPPELWEERMENVLAVIYLIFNEGYSASSGQRLIKVELCQEAIRLCKILTELVPQECEASGLLALMILHESRREARTDNDNNLITLEDQDRNLWDGDQINLARSLLLKTLIQGRPGPYQVQAAISAMHAQAKSYGETDWQEIVSLYNKLREFQPNPVITLNLAVAVSFADGPKAGLARVKQLEEEKCLENYQPLFAAKADILRRLERPEEACTAYRQAIELSHNDSERRFLQKRLNEL